MFSKFQSSQPIKNKLGHSLTVTIAAKHSNSSKIVDNAQLNDNKKKRLATTRGFGTASSFGGTAPSEVNSFITPQNSPSKFLPQVKSTPANDLLTFLICYQIEREIYLQGLLLLYLEFLALG